MNRNAAVVALSNLACRNFRPLVCFADSFPTARSLIADAVKAATQLAREIHFLTVVLKFEPAVIWVSPAF